MKLSEIFSQLTYGELSQLSIGGAELGEISEVNYAKVLSHINLGLAALYKRFPLKEVRYVLPLVPGQVTYSLGTVLTDLLKIERVYTDADWEMALNDDSDALSCFTTSMSTLRVPASVVAKSSELDEQYLTDSLTLVYRANHPAIVQGVGLFDPTTVEVELPYSHLECLLLHVASRVNNPIGMTNEFHAGNSYHAKYEKACQELEVQNIRIDQGSQNNRLVNNGWV